MSFSTAPFFQSNLVDFKSQPVTSLYGPGSAQRFLAPAPLFSVTSMPPTTPITKQQMKAFKKLNAKQTYQQYAQGGQQYYDQKIAESFEKQRKQRRSKLRQSEQKYYDACYQRPQRFTQNKLYQQAQFLGLPVTADMSREEICEVMADQGLLGTLMFLQ